MIIFIPKETDPEESRTPIDPASTDKLVKLGATVEVESGVGLTCGVEDAAYEKVGAKIVTDRVAALAQADMVLRLNPPPESELDQMKKGVIHISHLDPFNRFNLLKKMADAGISAISMELIPRTTIAQKMDALSSQANLAGYVAVCLSVTRLNKILPMMMTPAGTLPPARVFIIGAGVAGLQAIATAKRLGARVDAYDTRPDAQEQIMSLGGKVAKMDLGETGQTAGGYAKKLTEEQIERQRQETAKICAKADIVITTAKVFGHKSPLLVTEAAVQGMQPGSVIVDMAASADGGNVAGSVVNEEVEVNGVKIIGHSNLAGYVPVHATQMYASNMGNLIEHFWDEETKAMKLDREDEIIQGALVSFEGAIVNNMIKERMG